MSQDRVLYWGSGSPPCWRAMLCLEEKGLPYESKLLEFSKGEHKGPEVLAINPRGQLPTFKDGDAVVNESIGICFYLDSQYPEKPLLPTDAAAKAKVFQRIFESAVSEQRFRAYSIPKIRSFEDPQEEQHIADIKAELTIWDGHLSKDKYIAGDEFTLADVVVAPPLLVNVRFGMTYKDYPNLKRYVDMLKVTASYYGMTRHLDVGASVGRQDDAAALEGKRTHCDIHEHILGI